MLLIASKLPSNHRIGIDAQTLERFNLKKADVEEKVLQEEEKDKHLKNLQKLQNIDYKISKPYNVLEWQQMIKYLEGRKCI